MLDKDNAISLHMMKTAACVSFNLQFKVQMQDFKLKMWREKVMTSVFCTTAMWLPGKVENVWNSA